MFFIFFSSSSQHGQYTCTSHSFPTWSKQLWFEVGHALLNTSGQIYKGDLDCKGNVILLHARMDHNLERCYHQCYRYHCRRLKTSCYCSSTSIVHHYLSKKYFFSLLSSPNKARFSLWRSCRNSQRLVSENRLWIVFLGRSYFDSLRRQLFFTTNKISEIDTILTWCKLIILSTDVRSKLRLNALRSSLKIVVVKSNSDTLIYKYSDVFVFLTGKNAKRKVSFFDPNNRQKVY